MLACVSHAQPQNSAISFNETSTTAKTTLVSAFEAAWKRAVAASEVAGLNRQAQAEKFRAEALWAAPPFVEVSHRNDRLQSNKGARETEISVAVPLWLPGQKAAKQDVASAALELSKLSHDEARLRVAESTRELLWQIAELEASMKLTEQQVALFQAIADDVDKRVSAGDLARTDALAAKGELLNAQTTHTQAIQQLGAAKRQWTALTGLVQVPSTLPADMEQVVARNLEEHPELRFVAQQVAVAQKRVTLVDKSKRDAPELITSMRQDVGGRGMGSANSLGVALRIPLGTADRNAPLEAAALSELEIAQSREQVRRTALVAAVDNATSHLRSIHTQLEAEKARSSMLKERSQLMRSSFNAGETALLELLRATNASAQSEFSVARQEAAMGLARARLQQAYGQLP
ncbi:Outer membrane protein TolC [Giesbergeria anulus]|uniref:Outer membrane protein TolC n=2 Tax=Giesbergeria anulus TaxID=180197 RepID=A0A1H9PX29_9BURK|nr:Outer membrane protein TolC [Giesbergeria anulus]